MVNCVCVLQLEMLKRVTYDSLYKQVREHSSERERRRGSRWGGQKGAHRGLEGGGGCVVNADTGGNERLQRGRNLSDAADGQTSSDSRARGSG